jgi:hypothetical protein
MRRIDLAGVYACLIALLIWSTAPLLAQSVGPVGGPGPGNVGPSFQTLNGHPTYGGLPPTANASCGTGSQVLGTDASFALISGTSTSAACAITPIFAWNRRPICQITDQAGSVPAYTVSPNGTITISGVVDSHTYNVDCVGQPGG